MRQKLAILLAPLILTSALGFCTPPRIAVEDFKVSSTDPKLTYIGKGLAEMFAAVLVQAKDIFLIDRDRRAELLSEQEFALSDAADPGTQVQIGKLLSADYLVYGEIVDMDQKVLVTVRMVKVESGQVTWSDRHLGALSDYDLISSRLARSALDSLGAGKSVAVAASPLVAAPEKKEQAIIAFSRAVDSYDKKDTAAARKQLEAAKSIDPTNLAIKLYLGKLGGASPRFQVELDKYAPSYNPAYLGLIEKGLVYSWASMNLPWEMINSTSYQIGDYKFYEQGMTQRIGVLLPLWGRFGISAEVVWSMNLAQIMNVSPPGGNPVVNDLPYPVIQFANSIYGAYLGVGYRIIEGLSLGIAAHVAYLDYFRFSVGSAGLYLSGGPFPSNAYSILNATGFDYAVDGGVMYQASDGSLGADLHAVWSNQRDPYDETETRTLNAGSVPIIVAASVTGGFLNKTLFANLKGITDIYSDARSGYAFRAIPSLEWWPVHWLALRAGYEYSQLNVSGIFADGHGFMAGMTAVFGRLELNLNYVNRFRPYRIILGQGHTEQTLLIGSSWNGLSQRK